MELSAQLDSLRRDMSDKASFADMQAVLASMQAAPIEALPAAESIHDALDSAAEKSAGSSSPPNGPASPDIQDTPRLDQVGLPMKPQTCISR